MNRWTRQRVLDLFAVLDWSHSLLPSAATATI